MAKAAKNPSTSPPTPADQVSPGNVPPPDSTLPPPGVSGEPTVEGRPASEQFRRLTESAERLTEEAARVYETSRALVRSHPGNSVLGALVLGAVVGFVLGWGRG